MKEYQPPTSLAEEAYTVLRLRILRGELALGEVISRRRIAGELGMSFLPVSEAFVRLECEGLLESRPRAGTRVRIPTREDVEGHYVVREGLEVQAAKRFAQMATADERNELMKLAARVDAMSGDARSYRTTFLAIHERLHRRIAECGQCPALCDAIEKTAALSAAWLCLGQSFGDGRSANRHQELMEALCASPAVAAEAMREHVNFSRVWVLEHLEPYFQMSQNSGQTYTRNVKKPIQDKIAESNGAIANLSR